MAIFSDDFSSYSVGAGVVPPWEQIGLGANVIAGGFRGQGLQYQASGGIRRNTGGSYYNDVSIYFYFRFPGQAAYNHTLLELLNGPTPTIGTSISLFKLGFEDDGSLSITTPGKLLDNSSGIGISLYCDKWYFIQANVKFDFSGLFATVDAKVTLDGLLILDSAGAQVSTQAIGSLSNGIASVNKFDFHDASTLSIIDEILCNTPRDVIPNYPNPTAGFKGRITQAIIETGILPDDSKARITQALIENAILPDDSRVRITQMIIEIATARVTSGGWRVREI